MKRFLPFLMAAAAFAPAFDVFASEPVFPDVIDVKTDSPGVTIEQYEDAGTPMIEITGVTPNETLTVSFDLPEGWSYAIGFRSDIGILNNSKTNVKKVNPSDWIPVEMFRMGMAQYTLMEGTSFEFKADGVMDGVCFYLVSDEEEVDVENGFLLSVCVEQGEITAIEFPTAFNITADSENVVIEQTVEDEVLTINVSGTTTKDDLALTFEIPEGWDGIIGGLMNLGRLKRARSEWPSIDEFKVGMAGIELSQGNQFIFPADGEARFGQYFLYVGDQVDVDQAFLIVLNVAKVEEPEPIVSHPEFPEELDIDVDGPIIAIVITQSKEGEGLKIEVGGMTEESEIVLTFNLPEEWAGLVGGERKTRSAEEWPTLESFKENATGFTELTQGTELTFPVDGEVHTGTYFLYTSEDALVDNTHPVYLSVKINKKDSGLSVVGEEANAPRYFNLQGVETLNPVSGLYIKVENGKAVKTILK